MRMKDLCNVLFFLNGLVAISAQPTIQWQRSMGGSGDEKSISVLQTTDNGFVATGYTTSDDGDVVGYHGGIDAWVVKLDSIGMVQWKKAYGGSNNEIAYSIYQTSDDGFIVAGFTESNDGDVSGNHGDKDIWVFKLDSDGELQWQKTLGGSFWEEAWSVKQTKDGGFIIAGRANSIDGDVTGNHGSLDYWVVKLNNIGGLEWQRSLGGSGLDLGYSVSQTEDGGYIVVGESDSQDGDINTPYGSPDYWVVKLNFDGKIEWEKSLGGTNDDRGNDIQQTRDGGYIVFGQSSSINGDITGTHGDYDCWAVKLSSNGTLEWQKALGGSSLDFGQSIRQTLDDGYILAGITASNNGDVVNNDGGLDMWVVKLNEQGILEWQKTMGGTNAEIGYSIQQCSDGGYITVAETRSNDGDVSGGQGQTDFWIVKLSPESSPTTTPTSLPLEIYPNPATHSISLQLPNETEAEPTLSIQITDLLGRTLSQQTLPAGNPIDIAALPNGLYLLTATTSSNKVFSGRFTKLE
jgi:hypothetical protein